VALRRQNAIERRDGTIANSLVVADEEIADEEGRIERSSRGSCAGKDEKREDERHTDASGRRFKKLDRERIGSLYGADAARTEQARLEPEVALR